jgi:hypothetical protein
MGENCKKHVMEMIQAGDAGHQAAAQSMMSLSKEEQMRWYEEFKKGFNALPEA